MADILRALAIPILIAINAFFVAAEFALVSLRRTQVEKLQKDGRRGAEAVLKAADNLDRSLGACQFGITLSSIALGAVAEPALAGWAEPLFASLPETWQIISAHSLAITLALIIVTFVHVVVGEQVPKMAAIQEAERFALWVARPLNFFAWISTPFLHVMNGTGNFLLKRFGFEAGEGEEGDIASPEELAMMIEDTEEEGLLDGDIGDILQNVFLLRNKSVADCMVPRDKIDAIEVRTPFPQVIEKVRLWGHTRVPVYEDELDNTIGVLYTKDLFTAMSPGLVMPVILEDLLHLVTFLSATEKVSTAMKLFKNTRRPLAVVKSAEGKVVGMITLEDILEEIVGELEDEHDAPPPKAVRTAATRVIRKSGTFPHVPKR